MMRPKKLLYKGNYNFYKNTSNTCNNLLTQNFYED